MSAERLQRGRPSSQEQRYEHLTWEQVAAARDRGAGVVLPLGAIEQHGLHLPLDTDAFLASELALAGVRRHDVLVAPGPGYGYRSRPLSGGGPTFPGTVSLSGATYVAVVSEILARFIEQGFTRLLVYGWHMENQNFAYEASYLAAEGHSDVKIVVMEEPFAMLSPETMKTLFGEEFPGWPAEHAGIMETSLLLHLRPGLVDLSKATNERIAHEPPYDVIPPPSSMYTRSGVRVDAGRGTAAGGRLALRDIAAYLEGVLDAEFPELAWTTS